MATRAPYAMHKDQQLAIRRQGARGESRFWGDGNTEKYRGATPYWEDVYKKCVPTFHDNRVERSVGAGYDVAPQQRSDDVVGYAEFVEITDIAPWSDLHRVLITIEPLEQPGHFETTIGPFTLEQMKSVAFMRARCHDAEAQLEPSYAASKGYIQVMRVRVRVHFVRRDLRSENDLVFIGATDPIEISWHPERQVYPLRGLEGKPTGNIYFSHRLIHRYDIEQPGHHSTGHKVVLGKCEWPTLKGMVRLDVYSKRYLEDVKEMYPDQLLDHARMIDYCITNSVNTQYRLEPIPQNHIEEVLKWILKAQGNILIPFLNDEAHHSEVFIHVHSLTLRAPVHASFVDMMGGAGARVKVVVESEKVDKKQWWNKSTDIIPYNQQEDVKFKKKFSPQIQIKKDSIVFEVYEHHPAHSSDTLIGQGILHNSDIRKGFDGPVPIKLMNTQTNQKVLLKVKVDVNSEKSSLAGHSGKPQIWRGNFLEPRSYPRPSQPHWDRSYSPPRGPPYQDRYANQDRYGYGGKGYGKGGPQHYGPPERHVYDRRTMGMSQIETVGRGGPGRDIDSDMRRVVQGSMRPIYDDYQSPHDHSARYHSHASVHEPYPHSEHFGSSRDFDTMGRKSQHSHTNSPPSQSRGSRDRDFDDVHAHHSRKSAKERGYGSEGHDHRHGHHDRHQDLPSAQKLSPRSGGENQLGHGPDKHSSSWLGSALGSFHGMVQRSISHHTNSNHSQDGMSRDRDHMPAGVYGSHSAYEEDTRGQVLKVTLIKADNLRKADFMGLSDPYVKVELRGQNGVTKGKIKETGYKKQTLEPVWEEMVELKNYELGDELYFEVWDKDFGAIAAGKSAMGIADDSLGKARLEANDVALGFEDWLMLSEAGDTEGRARLKVKVHPPINYH